MVVELANETNTLLPSSNSGIEAGTDMAYAFVSQVHVCGEEFALAIATAIGYVPITNSSYNPFAAYWSLTSTPKPLPVSDANPFFYWGVLIYPGSDAVGVGTYPEWTTVRDGFPGNLSAIAPTLDPVTMESVVPGDFQQISPTHKVYLLSSTFSLCQAYRRLVHSQIKTNPSNFIKQTYPKVKSIISVGTVSMLLALWMVEGDDEQITLQGCH